METQENQVEVPCAFNALFKRNVPHILEMIFLSLDYVSFEECMKVNKAWRGLLTSEAFQAKAKLFFHEEICTEQKELWQASMWGKVEVAKRILSYTMVDVNYLGGFNDSTPLCEAAAFGRKEVAQLLLQRGADPEKADKLGQTPLYWATVSGHRGVIEVLLDGGADIKKAPLHLAAMKCYKNVVALLLERGADHKSVNMDDLLEFDHDNILSRMSFGTYSFLQEYEKQEILHQKREDVYKIIKDHMLAKKNKKRNRNQR